MNKAQIFRNALKNPGLITLAGAHNALSAKLVEEAGFEGIWASGFEISASRGVPDASFLTMTESLGIARQISDAVSIPVIADADDGFGNAINVMRTVEEYEQAGIAGICIEDNIFPKRCSFFTGVKRELVSLEEHAAKVKAAKAAQKSQDFVVIARTEALIAGMGLEEAFNRVRAYAQAGADCVLVHTKSPSFDELHGFSKKWFEEAPEAKNCPLVIVPTTCPEVTLPILEEAGFKVVIFANHAVRSSIKAMRETLSTLRQAGTISAITDKVVPLEDVYELMGLQQLKDREKTFLAASNSGKGMKAVIVAAGFEKQLLPLIEDKPKCLLDIKGKSILERQVDLLMASGVKDITVVRGYQKEKIDLPGIRYYDNDDYENTGELFSLFCAEQELNGPFLFLYSDILFEQGLLERLLKRPEEISLVIDRAWPNDFKASASLPPYPMDLVETQNPPDIDPRFMSLSSGLDNDAQPDQIKRIGQQLDPQKAHGEFIGLAKFSAQGAEKFLQSYHAALSSSGQKPFYEAQSLKKAAFTDFIQALIDQQVAVHCLDTYKGWIEVDTFEDYQQAWAKVKR